MIKLETRDGKTIYVNVLAIRCVSESPYDASHAEVVSADLRKVTVKESAQALAQRISSVLREMHGGGQKI